MRMGTYSHRNLEGLVTPQFQSGSLFTDGSYGLAPGSPCYDTTHDNGMIHCGSTVAGWFLSNVTSNCSAYEQSCASGSLVTVNPPSTPIGYNPATGTGANPDVPLTPAPSTLSQIPCADGSTGSCQPADPNACSWYCGIPFASTFSPTYTTDCVGCTPNSTSTFILFGLAAFAGILLIEMAKGSH